MKSVIVAILILFTSLPAKAYTTISGDVYGDFDAVGGTIGYSVGYDIDQLPPSATSLQVAIADSHDYLLRAFFCFDTSYCLDQNRSSYNSNGIIYGHDGVGHLAISADAFAACGFEECPFQPDINVSVFNLPDGFTLRLAGAVPEPSTWAMLLIGFAGLGFMAYRKRGNLAAA